MKTWHAPAGDDADGGSLYDLLYAKHDRPNGEAINCESSIERTGTVADRTGTAFAGAPPTQNQPSEPELCPGMCWGVEIMWSRTFVTKLKSTHPTLAAANEAAKLLYEGLPQRDCETVSCDEPGKPFNAFACINWGGNSLTVSVDEVPKPKAKKPSKPCNGVGCKKKTTLRCPACAAPVCRGCRARAVDKSAPVCAACLHERVV